MANFSSSSVVIFLLLVCYTCSTTGINLESRFLQLEKKFVNVKEALEAKVVTLETKVARLEAKVEQQESQIAALIVKEKERQQNSTTKKFTTNIELNQKYKRNVIFRTCQELHSSNPLLESGMYWIDPDGQGVGDDAIHVFCNMATGETAIGHDIESKTDVGKCAEPGCYSRKINYYATDRQIEALKGLSIKCSQTIEIDCNKAPLKVGGIDYSSYHNKHGKQTFSTLFNNCNTGGNTYDNGIWRNNQMPITRLNFGGTLQGSIKYTLRKIKCEGKAKIEEMPKSCEDLWRIGHTLNGIFAVKGNKSIESVFCDFTKRPNENDFQKWIGHADVKSTPVYFLVKKNSSFTEKNKPIPFEVVVLNDGNAMNLTSGKFMAPRPGIYFFSFTGMAGFPASSSSSITKPIDSVRPSVYLRIRLFLNGKKIGVGNVQEANTIDGQHSPFTVQSTLKLKSGDQVWVEIEGMSPGAWLHDHKDFYYNHFAGFMLEEEIVASL